MARGVPAGQPLLSANLATGTPSHARTIVVTLPPKSDLPVANDKRYYVAVLGGGFHGLLVSKTTRIPGLRSIAEPGQRIVITSVDCEASALALKLSLNVREFVFSILARVVSTTSHVETGWPAASRVALACWI